MGNTITKTYDSEVLYAVATTDSFTGLVASTVHDQRTGQVLEAVDVGNRKSEFVYDGLGRVLHEYGPDPTQQEGDAPRTVLENTYAYHFPILPNGVEGRPGYAEIWPEPGLGAPSTSFHDGFGRLIANKTYVETDPGAGEIVTLISGLTDYDLVGRTTKEWPPYDSSDLPGASAALDTLSVDMSRDAGGVMIALEAVAHSEFEYDEATGLPTAQIFPYQTVTEVHLERPGVRATVNAAWTENNADGAVTIEYSDNMGRVVRTDVCAVLPDIEAGESCGDLAAADLLVSTEALHDGLDRVVKATTYDLENGSDAVTEAVYDGLGNLVESRPANAGAVIMSYNEAGQLVERTTPRGYIVSHDYDIAGRLILTDDALTGATLV